MHCIVLYCVVPRHVLSCHVMSWCTLFVLFFVVFCVLLYYCLFVTPGLSSGKTVWSTAPATWSGRRRLDVLVELEPYSESEPVSMFDSASASAAAYVLSESISVHRSLYTSQPSWCSFQGVTCGSVSGSSSYANLMSIELFNLGLSGTLPSQIGSFGSLTYLSLSINQVNGSIPSSIGAMTSLVYFSVRYCRVTGSIPASIG